jgi:F-type H+-transporting ATPase subunit a
MSGKKILGLILMFIVLELGILFVFGLLGPNSKHEAEEWFRAGPLVFERYGMQLEQIGKVERVPLSEFPGVPTGQGPFWFVDLESMKMTLVVDFIMLFCAALVAFTIRKIPGKPQAFVEMVVEFFSGIIRETLGKHSAPHIPTLVTLFFFILLSNTISVIPTFREPTADINVPLGLMLVMLSIVHFEAIRIKGIKHYLKEYTQPFIVMLPLNVIGELAKGVSLSFRLFGNISGGAIIILVISYLVKYTVLPVGLNLFFGLFVGTVQAFVFTMLSMTYIAVAISEN